MCERETLLAGTKSGSSSLCIRLFDQIATAWLHRPSPTIITVQTQGFKLNFAISKTARDGCSTVAGTHTIIRGQAHQQPTALTCTPHSHKIEATIKAAGDARNAIELRDVSAPCRTFCTGDQSPNRQSTLTAACHCQCCLLL